MTLKEQLQDDIKTAMRAKERDRLTVLRLVHSAIRQREIDDQVELEDADVLAVLDKMVKQRRDSISQYKDAGRDELAEAEVAEIVILEDYLPQQLSESELEALVSSAITESGASSMRDMGQVMALLKPQTQGRADMGAVSAKVKAQLG